MAWIRVKNVAGETGERFIKADSVTEAKVRKQGDVLLLTTAGVYQWQTTGTMAEYAELVKALGLTDVA